MIHEPALTIRANAPQEQACPGFIHIDHLITRVVAARFFEFLVADGLF